MIKHEVLVLTEQMYAGIKTVIPFKEAGQTDFSQLHRDVLEANIIGIDHQEHVMAMDTDFSEVSFSYTPLVPVNSYDQNGGYTHFTREQGAYCAFEVKAQDLNPDWFKRVFEYINVNKISLENTGYDLEYYHENYLAMKSNIYGHAERVLKILLKIKS